MKTFVRAWLKQSTYISQNSWTSKTKVLTDPISGEVPFPGLFAVFTQEEEGAVRKRENEKERISKYDFFFNATEYMSLELQGQTWTGEENAEATGDTGVQGHETEREDEKEPRPRKRTVMCRD